MNPGSETADEGETSRDGLAAIAIIVLTIALIAFVVLALI